MKRTQLRRIASAAILALVISLHPTVGHAILDHRAGKIIGGNNIALEEAPWQVAIITKGQGNFQGQFCGGSLISPYFVLTAAHCVEDIRRAKDIEVLNADFLDDSKAGRAEVKRIILHPHWNPVTFENDIALIELRKPVKTSFATSKSFLALSSSYDATFSTQISGWGNTAKVGAAWPRSLKGATISVSEGIDRFCQNNVDGFDANTMFCGGIPPYRAVDTCQGDSGGPLSTKIGTRHFLLGITSWGINCADGFPGVYTRVSAYFDWVTSQEGLSASKLKFKSPKGRKNRQGGKAVIKGRNLGGVVSVIIGNVEAEVVKVKANRVVFRLPDVYRGEELLVCDVSGCKVA